MATPQRHARGGPRKVLSSSLRVVFRAPLHMTGLRELKGWLVASITVLCLLTPAVGDSLSTRQLREVLDLREGLSASCQKLIRQSVLEICRLQWPGDQAEEEFDRIESRAGAARVGQEGLASADLALLSGLAARCVDRDAPLAAAELFELEAALLRGGCLGARAHSSGGVWYDLAFDQRDFPTAIAVARDQGEAGWDELTQLLQETEEALQRSRKSIVRRALTNPRIEDENLREHKLNEAQWFLASKWERWSLRYVFEGRALSDGIAATNFAAEVLSNRNGGVYESQYSALRSTHSSLVELVNHVGDGPEPPLTERMIAHGEELDAGGWMVLTEGSLDPGLVEEHLEGGAKAPIVVLEGSDLLLLGSGQLKIPDEVQVWIQRGTRCKVRKGGSLLVEGGLKVIGPGTRKVEFRSKAKWKGLALRSGAHAVWDLSIRGATVGLGIVDNLYRPSSIYNCEIEFCDVGIGGTYREGEKEEGERFSDAMLWIQQSRVRDCSKAGMMLMMDCTVLQCTVDSCGVGLSAGGWARPFVLWSRFTGCETPVVVQRTGSLALVATHSSFVASSKRDPRVRYADPGALLFESNYWGSRVFKPEFLQFTGLLESSLASQRPEGDLTPLTEDAPGSGYPEGN
jgi:hypothetical protein